MTAVLRDAEFVDTVARDRPTLQSAAFLLVDDPRTAADRVDAILARLYEREVPASAVRMEALRALVGGDLRSTSLPWRRPDGFELRDTSPRPAAEPILADLGRLPRDQRTVLVLAHIALLPPAAIAEVLDRPPAEIAALTDQARLGLAAGNRARTSTAWLAGELRAALPAELLLPQGGFEDLDRGRRLVRRRWFRRGSSVAAALLVVVVLASQLWPRPPDFVPSSAPPITNLPTTPTPTPRPTPSCDTRDAGCRATILRVWRAEMAAVAEDYLDPDHLYLTGTSFSYDDRYESPGVWSGHGRMGLDLFRMQGGSTEIYLQVATTRREAVRCGTTTHNRCVAQRFMDGNRFVLSETTAVAEGIEVQYSPDGTQVITVIARNREQGRQLRVDRGDLIRLVQDRRVRLPVI